MSTQRTDIHRPGAIVPSNYELVMSYLLPGYEPWDEYNSLEMRTYTAKHQGSMFGRAGKCGVCGDHFRAGDVWVHVPTGDLLHIGHDCARKYEMLADRPDFNAALESLKVRREAELQDERAKLAKLRSALAREERHEVAMARRKGL